LSQQTPRWVYCAVLQWCDYCGVAIGSLPV
jgi:hypothetical protein